MKAAAYAPRPTELIPARVEPKSSPQLRRMAGVAGGGHTRSEEDERARAALLRRVYVPVSVKTVVDPGYADLIAAANGRGWTEGGVGDLRASRPTGVAAGAVVQPKGNVQQADMPAPLWQYSERAPIQRSPDRDLPEAQPEPHAKGFIYHVTSAHNLAGILHRKGLLPLNWIIEGTNGQEADQHALQQGLDAARGESSYISREEHAKEVETSLATWNDPNNASLKSVLGRRVADIRLGRKADFVYGTRQADTVMGYVDEYIDRSKGPVVILRWKAWETESYYKDTDSPNALKILSNIPLERLDVAELEGSVPDKAGNHLELLPWRSATNAGKLILECLRRASATDGSGGTSSR